ncbi:antibiotic biosynthesis monooxygenase [Streptomyces sp. NPDC096311]|uniref:antibiotic biosynthesis monooxygenase n=1 Tax=Streptomyces sp. NPDC096311 TaxID=3366083 RepID=UPI00381CBE34
MLIGNYAAMEKIRAGMASVVNDPNTAEKLLPYYNLGCNRPQFSDTYLQAYNRPNVTLLDTEGRGIERLTAKGIVVDGVEYAADCVVFGTGFAIDACRFPVAGRDGELLSDKWADGVRSLHGILTAGFPNLFVVGGIPQATHAINFTHQLYDQTSHVSTIIRRCLDQNLASVDVRPEAEGRWAQQIKDKAAALPRPDLSCAPNRQTELIHSGYPGGPIAYAQACREWLQGGRVRPRPRHRAPDRRSGVTTANADEGPYMDATATITAHTQVTTLINVFTVKPENQRALVDLLVKTTDEVMRHREGFISTAVHASTDGTRVANYAQWETEAHLRAVLADPAAQRQLGEAQKFAESFEPNIYTVESVHHR